MRSMFESVIEADNSFVTLCCYTSSAVQNTAEVIYRLWVSSQPYVSLQERQFIKIKAQTYTYTQDAF